MVHIRNNFKTLVIHKILFCLLTMLLCVFLEKSALADVVYENPETGYIVTIEDTANLLNEAEEDMLLAKMKKITKYGSIAFKSTDSNPGTTENYAKLYYNFEFREASGTVFLIDMNNREIYIYSAGEMHKTISRNNALTITDNVYKYATDREYYECALNAYSQMLSLLEGKRIPQPMKYICNILLALILSFMVNYIIVRKTSFIKKDAYKKSIHNLNHYFRLDGGEARFINATVEYSKTNSRGGGGYGGFGGGSSGGGFSGGGGGGGHSF